MADKRAYRNVKTGIVREYPTAFASVYPDLVETDDHVECITCQPTPAEVARYVDEIEEIPVEEPAEEPIEEPAGSADDKEE